MKRKNKIIIIIAVTLIMVFLFSVPAFAISEGEVQGAIDKYGKEAVTGNIFVWFLCAIAFLKVSQKIDSFLAGLGLNVGHTGSSMLAEAMIAARGIFAAKQFASGSKGSSGGSDNSSGSGGFMGGGVGSGEDGLFKFKRSFYSGPEQYRFHIGRKIFDQEKYDQLTQMRTDLPESNFFPKYRA